jgi:hypothetical protein
VYSSCVMLARHSVHTFFSMSKNAFMDLETQQQRKRQNKEGILFISFGVNDWLCGNKPIQ